MDFSLSEEQKMLSSMARDFLTAECPKKLVREMIDSETGYTPELWQNIAELGWLGLVFPEEYEGTEMSFLDLTVLLEEMGRSLLPGPFFATVVLGGLTILSAGSEEQKSRLLPKIANGELITTLAYTEPQAGNDISRTATLATADGDNYILNGTKLFVPDAHIANNIIVAARTAEGITLFIVDAGTPGLKITLLKTIAGDKQCEVTLDNVRVGKENILGSLGEGETILEDILQKATVARCAEMVGGAQQVFEMTMDYAKDRKQSGQAIGSFQIIQHYLADMLIDLEAARFLTAEAAFNISEGLPCGKAASIAKTKVSEAYRRITAKAQQIHGAIGFSAEYDLYLYFRKAKALEVLQGDPEFHREKIAQEIGL